MQVCIPILLNVTDANQIHVVSSQLANQKNARVDRIQAFIRALPTNGGAVPTLDQIKGMEQNILLKFSTDVQQTNLLTQQPVPVAAFQSRDLGPVPIQPFDLKTGEQFTVEWSSDAQNFLNAGYAAASRVFVQIVLWATDDRK